MQFVTSGYKNFFWVESAISENPYQKHFGNRFQFSMKKKVDGLQKLKKESLGYPLSVFNENSTLKERRKNFG